MRHKGLIIAGTLVITMVLTVVFASRFGQDPTLSPSPLIGKPAPDLSFEVFEDGASLDLADLTGQIVVANFWAPWCIPCREEHPALLEVAADYAGFDVTVVGIVYQSAERDITAFLDELGRGYRILLDDRSRAAIEFGVRGVPETYFIDRTGTVVAKITGPITKDLVSATLDRIVLGEAPDSVTTGDLQVSP